jgi:hypothetical protein
MRITEILLVCFAVSVRVTLLSHGIAITRESTPSPELDRKGTRTSRMNCVAPLIVQKVWRHGDGRVEFWRTFLGLARTHSKAEHQPASQKTRLK